MQVWKKAREAAVISFGHNQAMGVENETLLAEGSKSEDNI